MNHSSLNTHVKALYSVVVAKISSMNMDHTPLFRSFDNDAVNEKKYEKKL